MDLSVQLEPTHRNPLTAESGRKREEKPRRIAVVDADADDDVAVHQSLPLSYPLPPLPPFPCLCCVAMLLQKV